MSRLFKKVSLIFLSSVLFLNSMIMPFAVAKAADEEPSTWYNQGFTDWYAKVYGDESPPSEIFGERYTAAQVQWIIYGLFAFIINTTSSTELIACISSGSPDLAKCAEFLNATVQNTPDTALIVPADQNKTLFQLVFADRSFSGIGYLKEKFQSFSLIPEAQAQTGFGFGALDVIQDMWSTSRNIAFGLFVLASVVLAFMIMFRVKISPQVVISVQSSIPKMIFALILVTFSYAIAGFLIDLMYVVYGVLGLLLRDFMPFFKPSAEAMFNFLVGGRLFGIPADIGIFGLVAVYAVLFVFCLALTLFTTLGVLPSLIGAGVTLVAFMTPLSGFLVTIGTLLIVASIIFLIFIIIKIIFSLLKTYVNILLLTIFAPLQIVAGVFMPSIGFNAWLKSYISNLAVFVLTSVMFYLAFVFLIIGTKTGLDAMAGAGPFIEFVFKLLLGSGITSGVDAFKQPAGWPPLVGGANGSLGLILIGVSFVVFSSIPKANEIIQSFISGKPFSYGSAIGEAVGPSVNYIRNKVMTAEESRKASMQNYTPSGLYQTARSFGIIK